MYKNLFTRIAFIVIISFSLNSCGKQKFSSYLEGFWVLIEEDEYYTGVIEFQKDSVTFYPHFGITQRAAFRVNGNEVELTGVRQLGDNYSSQEIYNVDYHITDDTLIWNNSFHYVKSKYSSYAEHYANSKGLQIDLPESNLFIREEPWNVHYIDFFVGFKEDGTVGILINNEPAEHFQTYERIKLLQDTLEMGTVGCRVFADKNIDIMYIHDIHTTMRRMAILPIHYVTVDSNDPYTDIYGGNKFLISNIQISIVDDI